MEAMSALQVGLVADGPYVDLAIGLNICGDILDYKICASDFTSYFPWQIMDEKLDISAACGGKPRPPAPPMPPPPPTPM